MSDCPYCGQPAADVQEEVAHMQAAHPDIIRERLGAIGIVEPEPGSSTPATVILRTEYLVVDAPGWPGGHNPWPQTEANARRFVAEHGGTLRTRRVTDWEDA